MTVEPSTHRFGADVYTGRVQPEWIDINEHMNVAYYVLAFDLGVDSLWARFGLTEDFMREQRSSTFAVESHLTWQQEMLPDAPFVITSEVLAYDRKRIHQFMRMYHADEGYLAATAEWMNLHVNIDTRRVAPWPQPVLEKIAKFARSRSARPMPPEVGRRMSVRSPDFAAPGYSSSGSKAPERPEGNDE